MCSSVDFYLLHTPTHTGPWQVPLLILMPLLFSWTAVKNWDKEWFKRGRLVIELLLSNIYPSQHIKKKCTQAVKTKNQHIPLLPLNTGVVVVRGQSSLKEKFSTTGCRSSFLAHKQRKNAAAQYRSGGHGQTSSKV